MRRYSLTKWPVCSIGWLTSSKMCLTQGYTVSEKNKSSISSSLLKLSCVNSSRSTRPQILSSFIPAATSFTASESSARMNLHFTLLPRINWGFLSKAPSWITQSTMTRLQKEKEEPPSVGWSFFHLLFCNAITPPECRTRCPGLPIWLAGC